MMSKNPEMVYLKSSLRNKFKNINIFKEGPASQPDDEKTNVVGKYGNVYIKGFTKTGKILGKTEFELINLFNNFFEENNSNFSGPKIIEEGETEDGGCYFGMEDAGGIVNLSKMELEKIMEFYRDYRNVWDKFEKYSKGKTSTNSEMQRFYYFYKKYLKPGVSSESTTKSSKIINGVKTALCNVLQPAFKLVIGRNYKSKINERISNGEEVVERCGMNIDREMINKTLNKLLSKVKRFDFEYNFGRLWTYQVFFDGEIYRFVDFDNVGYQIEGTELICLMWDNLLNATGNYKSYEEWKSNYDRRYEKLLETYEDKNLVNLLLFVKLVGTVFEDYGNLIYNREVGGEKKWQGKGNFEEIKKGVIWNYSALQELMDNVG